MTYDNALSTLFKKKFSQALSHIFACGWYLVASMEHDPTKTWVWRRQVSVDGPIFIYFCRCVVLVIYRKNSAQQCRVQKDKRWGHCEGVVTLVEKACKTNKSRSSLGGHCHCHRSCKDTINVFSASLCLLDQICRLGIFINASSRDECKWAVASCYLLHFDSVYHGGIRRYYAVHWYWQITARLKMIVCVNNLWTRRHGEVGTFPLSAILDVQVQLGPFNVLSLGCSCYEI